MEVWQHSGEVWLCRPPIWKTLDSVLFFLGYIPRLGNRDQSRLGVEVTWISIVVSLTFEIQVYLRISDVWIGF